MKAAGALGGMALKTITTITITTITVITIPGCIHLHPNGTPIAARVAVENRRGMAEPTMAAVRACPVQARRRPHPSGFSRPDIRSADVPGRAQGQRISSGSENREWLDCRLSFGLDEKT